MEKFSITIASLPNRENLVVEISQETNESIIQFYSHPRQDYWEFVLDEALEALAKAKKRLLDLEKRRT